MSCSIGQTTFWIQEEAGRFRTVIGCLLCGEAGEQGSWTDTEGTEVTACVDVVCLSIQGTRSCSSSSFLPDQRNIHTNGDLQVFSCRISQEVHLLSFLYVWWLISFFLVDDL